MHYPIKIVIRKSLAVRVRVRVRLGLGLGLGLTKNNSHSFKKMIIVHFKKIVFARHKIKHGSQVIG